MKWGKVFQKAIIGAVEGGLAGVVVTGGNPEATGLAAIIVSFISAFVNWFKHK